MDVPTGASFCMTAAAFPRATRTALPAARGTGPSGTRDATGATISVFGTAAGNGDRTKATEPGMLGVAAPQSDVNNATPFFGGESLSSTKVLR
jgi:hypothetical protein